MKNKFIVLIILLASFFTILQADISMKDMKAAGVSTSNEVADKSKENKVQTDLKMDTEGNTSWYKRAWSGTKNYTNYTIQKLTRNDVTFESFYKESYSVGWGTIAIVTAVVVAATTVTVLSGGTAAPALASVAASMPGVASVAGVAGATGTAGAAATASGLATIGGLVGGGMAAGVIIVGSGLSIGSYVAGDYTFNKAIDAYSYSNFAKDSKSMMTLPVPKNNKGCDTYTSAISILEDIDTSISLSSEASQLIVKKAIYLLKPIPEEEYERAKSIVTEMGISDAWNNPQQFNDANDIVNRYDNLDNDERAKKESLRSLLYFITNNYKEARKYAELSISLSTKENIKYTFPSYIYATSSLYEENFNYDKLADEYLKYSFVNEPNNPIIPLLLSIHLDRMMYRFGDGMINEKALRKVFNITSDESLKDFRLQNYIIILSRYVIRLKIEQQKISSLALTDNKTIKNSPKTLLSIKKSFESYDKLIIGANEIVLNLEQIEVEDETEIEAKKQVNTFKELIVQHANDKTRLKELIQDLKTYQASLSADEIVQFKEVKVVTDTKDTNMYLYIGFGILFITLIGFLMTRRKEEL